MENGHIRLQYLSMHRLFLTYYLGQHISGHAYDSSFMFFLYEFSAITFQTKFYLFSTFSSLVDKILPVSKYKNWFFYLFKNFLENN